MGNVQIGRNIKRSKDQIDANGNIVRPFSKEIIQKNEQEFIPTKPEPLKPDESFDPDKGRVNTKLNIAEKIVEAEKLLADLRLQKKAEIERMKAELKKLEAE